jgi:hypothetical protein
MGWRLFEERWINNTGKFENITIHKKIAFCVKVSVLLELRSLVPFCTII